MIDFNEIRSQYTPDVQVELDREGGLTGQPADLKKLLLLGYKTSAGSAVAGAVKRITSLAKAKELFGEGSMLAVMAEAAQDVDSRVPLYGVAFAENAGGVAATGTITIATTATGSGTLKLWIGGRLFQVGIAKGNTVENIVDAIIAKVAERKNLPFTLTKGADPAYAITVTARNKGLGGNSIRMKYEIEGVIGSTCTLVAMASGATEGDPTSVLSGIEGDRWHLICCGLSESASLAALKAHQEKQSGVAVKKWGLGIIASVDTRTNAESLATTNDSYFCQIGWQQESPLPVYELAARFAAYRAGQAANEPVIDEVLAGVPPAWDETKWPTEGGSGEIEAAIEGGLTPLRPLRNGTCQIVRSVLTRQTSPAYRDHNPQEIWHYTCESIISVFAARVKGKRLKNESPPGRPGTITPERATALLNEILFALDKQDYLQGVKGSIAAGHNFAEVNAIEPTTRLDSAFDFIPVGIVVLAALKGTYRRTLQASL